MFVRLHPICITIAMVVALPAAMASPIAVPWQVPAASSAAGAESSPLVVDHAVSLTAFDGLKPGRGGRLEIGVGALRFAADGKRREIPADAIRLIAMEASTKGLLRGTAGTLASLAPNGAGQIYSAVRPGAATLTLFYADENGALHAVVLLVPKDSRNAITAAFARMGVSAETQVDQLAQEPAVSMRRERVARRAAREGLATVARSSLAAGDPRALRIAVPDSEGLLPPSFVAATYEALVAQAVKSGRFGTVWRQGDRRADGEGASLRLRVTAYKKGAAGLRGAIPVVGMVVGKTLIRADLSLDDAAGRPLVRQEVKGSKRMMGESIAAATSLAQRAIKAAIPAPAA